MIVNSKAIARDIIKDDFHFVRCRVTRAYKMPDDVFDVYKFKSIREVLAEVINSFIRNTLSKLHIWGVVQDEWRDSEEAVFNVVVLTKEELEKRIIMAIDDVVRRCRFNENSIKN